MGKVVPFVRQGQEETQAKGEARPSGSALRKAIVDHSATPEVRAQELIVEAVKMLSDEKSASRVPWLLEDCIDLLENEKGIPTGAASAGANSKNCQNSEREHSPKDPRHILNTNSDLSALIRRKD